MVSPEIYALLEKVFVLSLLFWVLTGLALYAVWQWGNHEQFLKDKGMVAQYVYWYKKERGK